MQIKSISYILVLSVLMAGIVSGCGKTDATTTATVDSSTSGSVAAAVGGAANGASGGTMAYHPVIDQKQGTELCSLLDALLPLHSAHATAAGSCPTIPTETGSNCSVSGTTATLSYSDCKFGASNASWTGSQIVAFTGATPTCGGSFPSTMTSVTRTFGSGTTRTSANGLTVAIDTTGSVTAANGTAYSGGTIVSFASGVRTQIAISGLNLTSLLFRHSLTTSAGVGGSPLTLTGGNTINSGAVVTFHNLAKVKAVSSFSNVTFSTGCCTPTSGTISTSFSTISGVTPTALGIALNGTTETLSFTGCGTATYSGIDGTSGPVTLGHCF